MRRGKFHGLDLRDHGSPKQEGQYDKRQPSQQHDEMNVHAPLD